MGILQVRKQPAKRLNVLRRQYALTALDRVKMVQLQRLINTLVAPDLAIKVCLQYNLKMRLKKSRKVMLRLLQWYMGTVSISHCDMWARTGKPQRVYVTIDSLRDAVILVYFRFKDKSQLRRLYAGFHFPSLFRTSTREKFTGEEFF